MSATTTQLLSSGEFCKLRYDTITAKSASANVSFYTNNSKMSNFELWHSCGKWAICFPQIAVASFHRPYPSCAGQLQFLFTLVFNSQGQGLRAQSRYLIAATPIQPIQQSKV